MKIQQKQVINIFKMWNELSFSKLLSISQRRNFVIEFLVDTSNDGAKLLNLFQKITINKHPSGTIAFIENSSYQNTPLKTSFFKRYRAIFNDLSDEIDQQKIDIYIENVKNILEMFNEKDQKRKSQKN